MVSHPARGKCEHRDCTTGCPSLLPHWLTVLNNENTMADVKDHHHHHDCFQTRDKDSNRFPKLSFIKIHYFLGISTSLKWYYSFQGSWKIICLHRVADAKNTLCQVTRLWKLNTIREGKESCETNILTMIY